VACFGVVATFLPAVFAGTDAFFAAGLRGGTALRGEAFVAVPAFVVAPDLAAATFFTGADLVAVFFVAGLLALAISVPS
jgi:hypothetical protein